MPVYEYLCGSCGPFSAMRPMSAYAAPAPCEGCGAAAPRALLTAPAFSGMDQGVRRAHATNERSANAPIQSRKHPPSCGCCRPAGKRVAEAVGAKSFPAARPWMISH
ncbi:MAG: zinc ribbon domain-containing protein [Acetobacteraceae bacterium]|nr:zinc ribbon domain-containing protein [Acetobacteraceae bacterium]